MNNSIYIAIPVVFVPVNKSIYTNNLPYFAIFAMQVIAWGHVIDYVTNRLRKSPEEIARGNRPRKSP